MRHLAFLISIAGCGGPTVKTEDPPVENPDATPPVVEPDPTEPDTTTPPCLVSVVSTSPSYGAVDVYYRAPVRVDLALPDPTATIVVSDADGAQIPGTSTVVDRTVIWTGDPLAPERGYTADIVHVCGADTLDFTTGDVGLPVEADLSGRVYGLDVAGGLWTEPVGGGPVFAALFSQYRLLVGVTDTSDPASLDLLSAIADDEGQNNCAPSVDLVDAVWTDPYFEVHAPSVVLETAFFGLAIHDFALTGAFAPDGSRLQGAVLEGIADTRALGAELGVGQGPDAVCNVMFQLGVSCTPCADGGVYCLDLRVEGVDGPEVTMPLRPLTAEEVAADPDCD